MLSRTGKCLSAVAIAVLFFLCSFSGIAESNEPFEIKRIGHINPYADNCFLIRSEEDGLVTIRIHDSICTYRVISERVAAGENKIHWDGCGYNQEKLYEKDYTVTAEIETVSGRKYIKSFSTPIEFPLQCLQYAMPSSDYVCLDAVKEWFLEYRTVTDGTVCIDVRQDGQEQIYRSYSVPAAGGKIARKDFTALTGKNVPQPGGYTVTVYEKSREEQSYSFHLNIVTDSPAKAEVGPTGEIMPERSMTEEEIWNLMMQPSVVVDIDFFKHQDVYDLPDEKSRTLGTLHGQTQGLKVIQTEGSWALIGAWNHEDASYMEGWVPLSRLKIEYPANEYGILIDKQKQTMAVFRNGQIIDTLLVSTGRAEKNKLYQETSAGCFLTGYHRVNFSMNGKKYDYVIQYDGGNLLHQTPYDWGQHKKDFSLGRGYLGAKASHACIRIQPEPGPGGLNAFWLFTHLPYHTRVIILDDPEERSAMQEKLKRGKKSDVDVSSLTKSEKNETLSDEDVVITFGGCLLPGGSNASNNKKNSFVSYVRKNGYDSVLAQMNQFFSSDDLTCINLCCNILNSDDARPQDKGARIAPAGMENIFRNCSVELLQLTGDQIYAYGQKYVENTINTVKTCSEVMCREGTVQTILKGHLFGFAGCSENEYLKDPEIIDRRISELKVQKCEKIIFLFSCEKENQQEHSIVQEAMSHRAVRAGADLVVGNQHGYVQGADWIEGKPVFYSLGDLLDGSTPDKPKKQQGILIRAKFTFKKDREPVSVTVVPVLPYGNSDSEMNEYCPTADMKYKKSEEIIRHIWNDTAEQFLKRLEFYLPDFS